MHHPIEIGDLQRTEAITAIEKELLPLMSQADDAENLTHRLSESIVDITGQRIMYIKQAIATVRENQWLLQQGGQSVLNRIIQLLAICSHIVVVHGVFELVATRATKKAGLDIADSSNACHAVAAWKGTRALLSTTDHTMSFREFVMACKDEKTANQLIDSGIVVHSQIQQNVRIAAPFIAMYLKELMYAKHTSRSILMCTQE